MLRAHRRAEWLDAIFAQLVALSAHTKHLTICVMLDRPAAKVLRLVERQVAAAYENVIIDVVVAPTPLVSSRGEGFMRALQVHYDALLALDPDVEYAALWDDDFIMGPALLADVQNRFDKGISAHTLRAESVFLWEHNKQYNAAFPRHWQHLFFKCIRGDKFPIDRMVHAPISALRGPSEDLPGHLHNFGYLTEADRMLTWDAYKRAGKVDAHTLCLIKPPKVKNVPAQ